MAISGSSVAHHRRLRISSASRQRRAEAISNGYSSSVLSTVSRFVRFLASNPCGRRQQPSEAIRGHQRSSEVLRCHQRSSEALSGHQRSSEVIRGHQRQLTKLTCGRRRHPQTSWNHLRRSCGVSARSTRSSRRICSGRYENWESTNRTHASAVLSCSCNGSAYGVSRGSGEIASRSVMSGSRSPTAAPDPGTRPCPCSKVRGKHIRGHQRSSEVLRGHQWSSEAISAPARR